MEVGNLDWKEAKRKLNGGDLDKKREIANTDHDKAFGFLTKAWDEPEKPLAPTLPAPMEYPEWHMIRIESPESTSAAEYLQKRGISLDIAMKYRILYSIQQRRVVFPIIIDGKVYGWQGRAIDQVEDHQRMRNNLGFRREQLIMFGDNLRSTDFAIVCEGPFDALKFEHVGGFCCTMGKVVTKMQKSYLFQPHIKKLYIALDEDASAEIRDLLLTSPIPTYMVSVPDSCKERCKSSGKKADFGECTMNECAQAFADAKLSTYADAPIYLNLNKE
jgi:hypothetical protein